MDGVHAVHVRMQGGACTEQACSGMHAQLKAVRRCRCNSCKTERATAPPAATRMRSYTLSTQQTPFPREHLLKLERYRED